MGISRKKKAKKNGKFNRQNLTYKREREFVILSSFPIRSTYFFRPQHLLFRDCTYFVFISWAQTSHL